MGSLIELLASGEGEGGDRQARVLILFIGLSSVRLVVVVDIHYELKASHDGRRHSLKMEVIHSPVGLPRQIKM